MTFFYLQLCNNLGGCTCNVGFSGSDCSTSVSGPGIYIHIHVCIYQTIMLVYLSGVGPINECLSNNGGCEHICMDTEDSHICECNTGFTLLSDGLNCNGMYVLIHNLVQLLTN